MNHTIQELEERLATISDCAERIGTLRELGVKLLRIAPQRTRELAAESRTLARKMRRRSDEGYATILHAIASRLLLDFETSHRDIEHAIEIAAALRDETMELKARCQLSRYYMATNDVEASRATAREIVERLEGKDRQHDELVSAYMALASTYEYLQQRQTALEIYRKAIEVCEKAGMRDDLGRLYTSVGALLDYSSDRTNGLVFLMKGLEIQKEADNPLDAIETHSALGKHYFIDDEFAAAAGHLREAVRLTRELGVVMMEPTNLDMLGLAYMFLERDDEALECFRRALEILNGPGGEKHLNYGYLLHHTGMLYEKLGELDRAQRFMLEAAERAEYQGNDILRSEVYESLFLLAERRGLFDQALVYHKNYAEARFACLDVETTAKLAQMQSDFHVQMLQKEQAIRELETARLRDEMEHRNRELAVATLQLVEKSEHVRKLKEQLREIRVAGCTGIDGALKKIESELGSENDWERFALHFGHVHPGFTERLAKEHPSLTPAEIKICSLLKVNLSNKEISNLLSIDVRTVEIHRGRVRKKLSLTRKDSLASFLTGL